MDTCPPPPLETAGLARRLAAILYDALLVMAILIVAAAMITVPAGMGLGIHLNPTHPLFRLYLLLVVLGFYAYFWTHGGQTLGMRAWRLRVVRDDGRPLAPADALRRWVAAWVALLPAGLGLLWASIDRDRLAWHDRLSATRVVLVPRDP